MCRRSTIAVALLVALAVQTVMVASASACSPYYDSPEEIIADAKMIFRATPVSATLVDGPGPCYYYLVDMKVRAYWKDETGDLLWSISVSDVPSICSPELYLHLGMDWIVAVFAFDQDGHPGVSSFFETMPIDSYEAPFFLQHLGEPIAVPVPHSTFGSLKALFDE